MHSTGLYCLLGSEHRLLLSLTMFSLGSHAWPDFLGITHIFLFYFVSFVCQSHSVEVGLRRLNQREPDSDKTGRCLDTLHIQHDFIVLFCTYTKAVHNDRQTKQLLHVRFLNHQFIDASPVHALFNRHTFLESQLVLLLRGSIMVLKIPLKYAPTTHITKQQFLQIA